MSADLTVDSIADQLYDSAAWWFETLGYVSDDHTEHFINSLYTTYNFPEQHKAEATVMAISSLMYKFATVA
jgi:hypothetical protein